MSNTARSELWSSFLANMRNRAKNLSPANYLRGYANPETFHGEYRTPSPGSQPPPFLVEKPLRKTENLTTIVYWKRAAGHRRTIGRKVDYVEKNKKEPEPDVVRYFDEKALFASPLLKVPGGGTTFKWRNFRDWDDAVNAKEQD